MYVNTITNMTELAELGKKENIKFTSHDKVADIDVTEISPSSVDESDLLNAIDLIDDILENYEDDTAHDCDKHNAPGERSTLLSRLNQNRT